MRSAGAIRPPQKGYLSDTCAIPCERKAQRLRYPPLRYYLEKVLRDGGGYLALGHEERDVKNLDAQNEASAYHVHRLKDQHQVNGVGWGGVKQFLTRF